ncbi:aspartate dehydrogenase [Marivibrio halodurans]|uniref:L-aspartate dehydrogenase n=1 Tax=Marivibrio halodurans TaxID=2039722 RepID=A0A8J7SJ43_9PROT|nr:aspartate dehydrogenase [Marivibrio halodurans]
MVIGIIGRGAIGRYVSDTLTARGIGPRTVLVRANRMGEPPRDGPLHVDTVADLPDDTTLMIDCAGHAALSEHGPAILERGIDLVTVSLGALADQALHDRLRAAAEAGQARLRLASGAIGALDSLQAARVGGLDRVTYIGRKPPSGWKGSPAEEHLDLDALNEATTHFAGSAREAALRYPKNANVAAAVALAGAGFDDTRTELIADPASTANIHEIHAEGRFGTFSFRIEGRALPDNPRSSALAAMSVIAAVERERAPITI